MKTGDIYTLKEYGSIVIITGFKKGWGESQEIDTINFKGEVSCIGYNKLDIRIGHIKDIFKFSIEELYNVKTQKHCGVDIPVEEFNIF